jgi:phosphatidylglycerophosphate synthase
MSQRTSYSYRKSQRHGRKAFERGMRERNSKTGVSAAAMPAVAIWSPPTHATIVLTGLALSLLSSRAWPLATGIALAFAAQFVHWAGRFHPRGGLGAANAITSLRLFLLLTAAIGVFRLPDNVLLALLATAFVLDAVDGAVARRISGSSPFGAALDTETDAIFVLILGVLLYRRSWLGAWVLAPGLLRYVYVLALALFPGTEDQTPRPLFGRMAFLISSTLLLFAKVADGTTSVVCAAAGTSISTASFARSFALAYPGWRDFLHIGRSTAATVLRSIASTVLFLVVWCFLDLTFNLRYPSPEPAGWYFLPSLDVTIMLATLAVMGFVGLRLPRPARITLVVALVVVRGLRIGDGVAGQSFGKLFNVYSDLPLVPELVRYAHSTVAPWKFYGLALVLLLAIALFIFSLDRALAYSARYFVRRWHGLLFATLALPFVVASAFIDHDPRYNQRYTGAFGASVVPRLQREVTFLLNVYDHRMNLMHAIAVVQENLRNTPSQLEGLHHANVYLFFVESYGATVFNRPIYVARSTSALRRIQAALEDNGFSTASGMLDSATYGGMSWLAHATFFTGVRTDNQLQYDLLGVSRPRTMARIAHEAGYRTILLQPNTNREARGADFYDFDESYRFWNFDYAGPSFAWATMPDQYVLDHARRAILADDRRPFLMATVLVSSHAPWSHIPTFLADWSRVGNGEVYHHLPVHRANTNWPDFSNASEPYLRSIFYDFDVLTDYIVRFVRDDSLVVVLGDHQPVSELTDNTSSWAVPIHVISKNASFTYPLLQRGYAAGMLPGQHSEPMEAFLINFLRDFSGGQADAYVDGQHGSGT